MTLSLWYPPQRVTKHWNTGSASDTFSVCVVFCNTFHSTINHGHRSISAHILSAQSLLRLFGIPSSQFNYLMPPCRSLFLYIILFYLFLTVLGLHSLHAWSTALATGEEWDCALNLTHRLPFMIYKLQKHGFQESACPETKGLWHVDSISCSSRQTIDWKSLLKRFSWFFSLWILPDRDPNPSCVAGFFMAEPQRPPCRVSWWTLF